jgi:hypothetical protein
MSAILSVTQPALYELNHECLLQLSQESDLREYVAAWGFAFNAVSVISNQSTPPH